MIEIFDDAAAATRLLPTACFRAAADILFESALMLIYAMRALAALRCRTLFFGHDFFISLITLRRCRHIAHTLYIITPRSMARRCRAMPPRCHGHYACARLLLDVMLPPLRALYAAAAPAARRRHFTLDFDDDAPRAITLRLRHDFAATLADVAPRYYDAAALFLRCAAAMIYFVTPRAAAAVAAILMYAILRGALLHY